MQLPGLSVFFCFWSSFLFLEGHPNKAFFFDSMVLLGTEGLEMDWGTSVYDTIIFCQVKVLFQLPSEGRMPCGSKYLPRLVQNILQEQCAVFPNTMLGPLGVEVTCFVFAIFIHFHVGDFWTDWHPSHASLLQSREEASGRQEVLQRKWRVFSSRRLVVKESVIAEPYVALFLFCFKIDKKARSLVCCKVFWRDLTSSKTDFSEALLRKVAALKQMNLGRFLWLFA